ncbi:PiggyBac transposable element-derived protein 4 [Plakobranchus ocellatus]|uniref:PiggyBac transposable element-derived protein 4 n=1 Tax=Plakobranchus ocellatus TaxID=259542 RepID=A0AAV4AA82_9GAST|nr:PiggyBac transposable element-derived protein 4 [Plakobranchus ocellatus]
MESSEYPSTSAPVQPVLPTVQVFLDLSDPSTLRQLTNISEEQGVVAELFGNQDSDIEDIEEPVPIRNNSVLSVHRDRLTPEDGSDEKHEEETVEEGRRGVTTPEELPFTGNSGVTEQPEDLSPLGFLKLMIDDDMIENIVRETNRYAAESLRGKALTPKSRFKKWVDVTVQEMWTFFGLIIAMGLVVIDDIEEYWSSHPLYDLPFFRSIMRRDKFLLILSFLHLADNKEQPLRESENFDPIFSNSEICHQAAGELQTCLHPWSSCCY